MNRTRALPFVLEVLDDGLRLYRRHLTSFMLIATAVLVVIAALALGCMAFVRTEIGTTAGWTLLAVLGVALLAYPLLIYAFAALSRATARAFDDQPITLGAALAISPLRLAGIVVFNFVFSIIMSIMINIMLYVITCPLGFFGIFGGSLLAAMDPTGLSSSFALIGIMGPSSLGSFIQLGATLACSVFAIQSFVLERRPWGEAAGRALDILVMRFGRSLLMFLGAGAIFATLTLAYGTTLLVLFELISTTFDLSLQPLVRDAIIIALVVVSLVVLLPPLAIWMALYYRRSAAERDGIELDSQLARWRALVASQV